MNIKLVLGKEERLMATDNGIPRVGDTVEFLPNSFAKVVKVNWKLLGGSEPYKEGFITHQAAILLKARRR